MTFTDVEQIIIRNQTTIIQHLIDLKKLVGILKEIHVSKISDRNTEDTIPFPLLINEKGEASELNKWLEVTERINVLVSYEHLTIKQHHTLSYISDKSAKFCWWQGRRFGLPKCHEAVNYK